LTRQIKAIEAEAWVARHSDPADNRLTNVELTDSGRNLIQGMLPRRNAFVDTMFGDLPPERMALLRTLLHEVEERLDRQRRA